MSTIKAICNRVWEIIRKGLKKVGEFINRIFPKRPAKYFDGDLHEAKYILLMGIGSFLVYLFIEEFARITSNPVGGFLFLFQYPIIFFYNWSIIFATMTIALLFKRRRFVWMMISLFWAILGIVNGVILLKRMTPFTLYDLQNMEDGFSLLNTYFAKWQITLGIVVVGLLIAAVIMVFIRSEKWKNIHYKKSVAAILLSFAFSAGMTFMLIQTGTLSTFFGNLNYAYRDYGFPYCFINTSFNYGISKPADYSEETILNILNDDTSSKTETSLADKNDNMEHPNIIVLQMESFTTAQDYKNISVDKDPTPVFNSLQDNFTSGYFTVPACGAGTANTEFEVLTGINTKFFGPGEYPYKGKLREQTLMSMGYVARSHGYNCSALHNHRALFYNRNEVYANLGFDNFTSIEYMHDIKKTPTNWCKDTVMIPEIMGIMKETAERDFLHIISVEGHGKYPTEQVFKTPYTTVSCKDEETRWKYEYYLNECHEMDTFIGDLINEINATGEPTVMIIYGDHIPALDVKEENYSCGDLYKTRYVMWDNIGLAKNDQDIYSYEAGAILLENAGLAHEGAIFDFQQTTKSKKSADIDSEYMKKLKNLAYDMIYGNFYTFGGANPLQRVNMKMGHTRIKIKDIVKIGDSYYITGENFTERSKLRLDDKTLKTVYLSPTLLGLNEEIDPKNLSKIEISQTDSKDDTVLSTITTQEEL